MKTIRKEEELLEARQILEIMEQDPDFITESAYRANADLWPGNRISFIDAHLLYLKTHPDVSSKHYLSNLRLKLRRT